MKIYQKQTLKSTKRRKWLYLSASGVLVLFITGWIFTGIMVKKKGFDGTADFVTTVTGNYFSSFGVQPEKVYLKIKPVEYEKLSKERKIALKRGVIINEPGSYVPATLTYHGNEMKVKIRLKGHMTDHIEGDQWSFRVRIEDKGTLMGMKLFSIQHPGTRGYFHEWIYHSLMRQEGIVALRYKFIEVVINGRSNGIYALEENFDKELLENNGRPAGPLVRFNPDLYWVNRYNEMLREKPVEEFSSFQSARLEAYREEKFISDPDNRNNFLKAIALMDGYREGKYKVTQVFDIEKLARFHAIIDLLGGYHSLDWSDVKYYFNPVTFRFEPVAYESFAVFPTNTIAGLYRFRQHTPGKAVEDLHVSLFSDITFYREYIKALKRITEPSYLETFFSRNEKELKENLAILNKAFPYKKFDRTDYFRNQKMIRKILNAPQGLNAYLQSDSAGISVVKVGNLEALPYEIIGVKRDSIAYLDSIVILPSKLANEAVRYNEIRVNTKHLPPNGKLMVLYRIPGYGDTKETEVLPYQKPDSSFIIQDLNAFEKGNADRFKFLVQGDKERLVFTPGTHIITEKIVIPSGKVLVLNEGVKLVFQKNGSLLSYSPVYFLGNDEHMPEVICNTESGSAITVVNTSSASVFKSIHFTTTEKNAVTPKASVVSLHSAQSMFMSCVFDSTMFEDAITVFDSRINISKSLFRSMPNDALDFNNATGTIVSCGFSDCRENAFDMSASVISVYDIHIEKNVGKAINVKQSSELFATNCTIENVKVAVSFENKSRGLINGLKVSGSTTGLSAFENNKGYGFPKVTIMNYKTSGTENEFLVQKGSSVTINGKEITEFDKKVKMRVDVK